MRTALMLKNDNTAFETPDQAETADTPKLLPKEEIACCMATD